VIWARLWASQCRRYLAVVNALLVGRLAAQPLFAGPRRLCRQLLRRDFL
jgi:hypothetical protein